MPRNRSSNDVIKSPSNRVEDSRQGALDLDPDVTDAERMIYRLAYENAQLIARLRRGGLPTTIDDPIWPNDTQPRRNSKPDPIAQLAASFAAEVVQLSSIARDQPDDEDAGTVYASIGMIAEEAEALITAVIEDAEDKGLEASGPWLEIPLVEVQAFKTPTPNPAADHAGETLDRTLNG